MKELEKLIDKSQDDELKKLMLDMTKSNISLRDELKIWLGGKILKRYVANSKKQIDKLTYNYAQGYDLMEYKQYDKFYSAAENILLNLKHSQYTQNVSIILDLVLYIAEIVEAIQYYDYAYEDICELEDRLKEECFDIILSLIPALNELDDIKQKQIAKNYLENYLSNNDYFEEEEVTKIGEKILGLN